MTIPDTPPKHPSSVSPIVIAALREDSTLVCQALIAKLLDPSDCNPNCLAHIHGFTSALERDNELSIPQPILEAIYERDLWTLVKIPIVASHLAERLLKNGCTLDKWDIKRRYQATRPIPQVVETTVLALATIGRLTREQGSAIRDAGWLRQEAAAQLTRLYRSAGAKQAAITRKQANATPITSANLSDAPVPVQPQKKDPLLVAIETQDTGRLNRFNLEGLSPERLSAVLPAWLAAPKSSIKAHLVRVPGLPPDVRCTALEACREDNAWWRVAEPIPANLLQHLTWQTAAQVLTRYAKGDLVLDPPPTDQDLTDALFRIAIQDPATATRVKEDFLLRAWQHTLEAIPRSDNTPPPSDPEAHWIDLMSQRISRSARVFTLALHHAYQSWPPERQAALADPILALVRNSITIG